MPSRKTLLVVTLVAIALTTLTVYAGLHFVGSARISFGSIIAQFRVAGFGGDTVYVQMHVEGEDLTAYCENKGGNQAPGQNPVDIYLDVYDSGTSDKNGNYDAVLSADLTPSKRAAGCPNGNWKVIGLTGTLHVTLTASAGGDTATEQLTCVINDPAETVYCY